jgi:DNA-binding LacI/PurR family transcriptional regulator
MSAKRRKQAYFEFCKKMNLRNPDWFIQRGDYTMRSGREAGLALLKNDEPPTAVIAANDLMAYGVMESARELEIPIPGGISVAGFDDLPTASERCPSLTAIHQPVAKMGRRSAKLLLDAVVRGDLPSGHTEMEVSLVVRQSTGPPGFV